MRISRFKIRTAGMAIALALTLGLLTDCKKKEDEPEPTPTPAPTNTEKLTGKNFKMTALTVDPAIGGITNLYAQLEDCDKDDFIRFESSGVYKEDEGAVKCVTTDPQTETGTWTWNGTETVITISISGSSTSFNVQTNDGTTLKGTSTENLGGTNYVITTTFTKM